MGRIVTTPDGKIHMISNNEYDLLELIGEYCGQEVLEELTTFIDGLQDAAKELEFLV
jgi:hypothetical protein